MNLYLDTYMLKFNKLALLSVCMLLNGCTSTELFLVNSLARLGDYTVIEELAYNDHEINRLNLYLPANPKQNSGTVVFFYGGCWGGCLTLDKQNYQFVAQALTAKGYRVIIPDYRHHPEVKFDAMMQDIAQSVIWTHEHIAEYGGDPQRIFLMGHSAGAHMAALLTLNEQYLPADVHISIKGFIGLAGPYDFLPFTEAYQPIIFGPPERYAASQPINYVNGNEAPLLLLFGRNDRTVKPSNVASLKARVQNAGGCVETHEYHDLDHVELLSALTVPFQNQEEVYRDIVDFLNYYSNSPAKCRT